MHQVLFVFLVDEMNMSEQKQQENTQQKNDRINKDQIDKEMLSAFIDAEQSDIETSQVIDALLNDPEYKKHYIRTQLINDHLHEQTQHSLLSADLRNNIALALVDLPAHFSEQAVSLQSGRTEDISRSSWLQQFVIKSFKKSSENRMLTGLSVAASVMFVTLFTLQNFNVESSAQLSRSDNFTENVIASSIQRPSVSDQRVLTPTPSLIQSPYALPAYLVSAGTASLASGLAAVNNDNIKQQYQWVEADPVLSRQVREYINAHEKRRSAYDLQAKIRTATYQISE